MIERPSAGTAPRRACGHRLGAAPGLGWLAAATLALLAAWSPVHALTRGVAVEVRAAKHADFGRLVLEWPSAVEVSHERLDDRFVVRFGRPFEADLAPAPARLGGYLRGLEMAADGRAAVLHLEPGVTSTLDVYDGRIVVIDLRNRVPDPAGAGQAGPAGAGPAEAGPAEAGSDAVRLRTGVHEGYARIVLDWPEPVAFDSESDEHSLRIRFARPLEIDPAALAEQLPDWVRSAGIGPQDGGSELRLGLREGVLPVVFQVGRDHLVVDLHEPASDAAMAASSQAAPSIRQRVASHEEGQPEVAGNPNAVATPAPNADNPAADDVVAAARPAAEADMAGAVSGAERGNAAGLADRRLDAGAQPLALVFRTEVTTGEKVLAFDWSRPIGAVVLLRAGYLWTVFADPAGSPVELPPFTPAVEGFLGPGEVVEAEGGVAVRFVLRRPLGVQVERSGGGWRIRLVENRVPPRPIDVVRTERPRQVRLLVEGPFARVRARDPEVGDMLEFWPLLDPGRGLAAARRLVDLELLATAQGIAWRPLADGLRSVAEATGIELATPHGPALFAGAPRAAGIDPAPPTGQAALPAPRRPTPAPAPIPPPADHDDGAEPPGSRGPLDLARWASAAPRNVREQRSQLMRRAGEQAAGARDAVRLDLARLFLSQAMAAEALAVLGVIEDEDGMGEGSPLRVARQGLAGAADVLMGRLEEATQALDHPELRDQPEIALWRAVLAAAEQDWSHAAEELGRSEQTLESYPPRLQLKLGLPAAMIALENGDRELAERLLARLGALDLHPTDRARVRFVQGLVYARGGAAAKADEVWRKLERTARGETRIKAGYARLRMLLDAGEAEAAEALVRLEQARPLWRGHPWEPTMLDGLAEAHLRRGDLPGAIRGWRELLDRHPDSPLADEVRGRMQRTFAAALTGGDGERLGPVRGFALYRDFPELVPDGAAGARLRRGLARQLAEVDLVAPAAALLRQVMESEPKGPERAALGAEMAELRLRQPDPAAALTALTESAWSGDAPRSLGQRRRQLEARALAALGRADEALAVLADAADEGSGRLRVEILWQQRDWPRLIGAIEPLLADLDAGPGGALEGRPSAEDQALLLQLAVAHASQGDDAALDELRRRFGPVLHEPPVGPAFQVVTLGSTPTAKPDAALALAEAHLGELRGYLGLGATP